MIPDNVLSSTVIKSGFKSPYDRLTGRLVDYELGGINLQDTSHGLQYQIWKCYYNTVTQEVIIHPENNLGDSTVLIIQSDVVELGFSFDQNMRWTLATLSSLGDLTHHWYDSTTESYVTSEYPGIFSVKLTLDDSRLETVNLGNSDNILTYTKISGGLFWREQRDRYTVEYTGNSSLQGGLRITNFGMSNINRLQWRLAARRF